jgi:hypothetical protein
MLDVMGLNWETVPNFEYFVSEVNREGLGRFFKEDPIEHWTNLPLSLDRQNRGWEHFISTLPRRG